jgi:catechol 2,3-dioxygenase-like lactoylglutathione lyase family enzyme
LFDHVGIRVSDFDASLAFYTTALAALDLEPGVVSADDRFAAWADYSFILRQDDELTTRNVHVAFVAPDSAHVDAFWRALTDAGFQDDGGPGPRPQYSGTYYGAFVRDPDGNSAEAVHEEPQRADGIVHHLWLRVADVEASRRFYAAIAPAVGLEVKVYSDEHVQLLGNGMSLSCVAGSPTTAGLHVAFGAPDDARVAAFHEAGLAGGGRDNGRPGERSEYHAGYYGAFLLDPDGNNIEAVCHNR